MHIQVRVAPGSQYYNYIVIIYNIFIILRLTTYLTFQLLVIKCTKIRITYAPEWYLFYYFNVQLGTYGLYNVIIFYTLRFASNLLAARAVANLRGLRERTDRVAVSVARPGSTIAPHRVVDIWLTSTDYPRIPRILLVQEITITIFYDIIIIYVYDTKIENILLLLLLHIIAYITYIVYNKLIIFLKSSYGYSRKNGQYLHQYLIVRISSDRTPIIDIKRYLYFF